jgi:hypothetical protein
MGSQKSVCTILVNPGIGTTQSPRPRSGAGSRSRHVGSLHKDSPGRKLCFRGECYLASPFCRTSR